MAENNSDLIITNDLYLAAYLIANGCKLKQCGRNARKRISFVIEGTNVTELREKYRTGTVELNVKQYRNAIHNIRNLMDSLHRSNEKVCPEQLNQIIV